MEADTPGAGVDGAAAVGAKEAAPVASVDAVQEILESLLSKKNLVRDQFVAGNMNPQMYIPIRILVEHERLKVAGATEAAVVAAAARSAKLGIDDKHTMVRPLLKSKRNVVILRELPEGTTEEEIRSLFQAGPHADRLSSVKEEVNNTWFVKFNLDDGTQDVVLWLRSQRFKGQPVNAAIKSEHFLRSFFPLHLASQGSETLFGMPPGVMPPGVAPPPGGCMMPHQFDMPPGAAPGIWPDGMMGMDIPGLGPGQPGLDMGMMPQMPEGMQLPGFWKPWGDRFQPPPLIFSSSTTLSPASLEALQAQAASVDPEVLAGGAADDEDFGRGGYKGDGKGKSRGKGKGKGAGYGGGGGGYCGGGYGGGGGGGGCGGCGFAGGYGGGGYGGGYGDGGWGDGGKGKEGGGGRRGWQMGMDWYAVSSGKEPASGKGKSSRRGGGWGADIAEGPPSAPPPPPPVVAVASSGGEAGGGGPAKATSYEHDYLRYSREDFERIAKAMCGEELTRPEALDTLGRDFPIIREAPSIDLAPIPA